MRTLVIAALLIAVPLVALAPTAEAAPECYDIYREYRLGPITIEQRSSCEYRVSVDDQDPLLP